MKTAAYLRVSTESQVGPDRYGLDAQREEIEAYAERRGLEIVAWYSDEGISGARMDRAGLADMLTDADGDTFDCVLVAKIDRLARDLFGQLYIENELGKHDVQILSASEPGYADDPQGRLLRQMLGAFAEFEKSLIAARLSGGRKQKAKRGGYAGGRPPVGYVATDKGLEVDPERADAVRSIFDLRESQGLSLRGIAAYLNEQGYTMDTGRPFNHATVKNVLERRDFYAGAYSYAGIESDGKHTAILAA